MGNFKFQKCKNNNYWMVVINDGGDTVMTDQW